jgi:nucleoid DNA-binding protein
VIPDLGTFKRATRKARAIRNPVTGARMRLPAIRTLGFHAAKSLRRTSK